jgi:hypothetical protein
MEEFKDATDEFKRDLQVLEKAISKKREKERERVR